MRRALMVCMLCLRAADGIAQEVGTVTGLVRADRPDVPIAGAKVALAGTAREVVTDASGRFTLANVPAGSHTLVFIMTDTPRCPSR